MHPHLSAARSDEEFSVFRPVVRAMKEKVLCVNSPLVGKAWNSEYLVICSSYGWSRLSS